MKTLIGILIFSTIETATVAIWGQVLFGAHIETLALTTKLLALGILEVGYIIEHIIALNVARGQPLLSIPKVPQRNGQ